jgi:hypothetical protein
MGPLSTRVRRSMPSDTEAGSRENAVAPCPGRPSKWLRSGHRRTLATATDNKTHLRQRHQLKPYRASLILIQVSADTNCIV